MNDLIFTVLQDILILLVTVGAGFLVAYLKRKLGVEKLRKLQQESELIKEIVMAGVRYAEQKFSSGEKLDAASKWIVERLAERNIKVSEEEINGLIESTLRQFKDEFGENWANAIKDDKN